MLRIDINTSVDIKMNKNLGWNIKNGINANKNILEVKCMKMNNDVDRLVTKTDNNINKCMKMNNVVDRHVTKTDNNINIGTNKNASKSIKFYKIFFVFLASFLPLKSIDVRILIDGKEANTGELWVLSCSEGFLVSDLKDPKRQHVIKSPQVSIGLLSGKIFTLNGKKIKSNAFKINSLEGNINYENRTYEGAFFVEKNEQKSYLINCIELENYVESGLRWEMVPEWPKTALEVGAIAYRTYALSTIISSRLRYKKNGQTSLYDIKNTPANQTYKGMHEFSSVHEAVRRTRGIVITYGSNPIDAQYDACCAGSIPAKRTGINFEKAPYLARPHPCKYCKACKHYNWSYSYTLQELTASLRDLLDKKHPKPITDIRVAVRDSAGVVQKIKIKTNRKWVTFSANKLTSCCRNVKSGTFSLLKTRNKVTFEGRGYGHQIGLCQWGVYTLAQMGWNHKRILKFYYPGTNLSKIDNLFLGSKLTI
jgi:stage II sporulation protein D